MLRERDRVHRRGRERGRKRIPNSFSTVSMEPDSGLEATNHEIMTLAEIKSPLLNPLRHPGTSPTEWVT